MVIELALVFRTASLCRGEAALSDTKVELATMPTSVESAAREIVFVRMNSPKDLRPTLGRRPIAVNVSTENPHGKKRLFN